MSLRTNGNDKKFTSPSTIRLSFRETSHESTVSVGGKMQGDLHKLGSHKDKIKSVPLSQTDEEAESNPGLLGGLWQNFLSRMSKEKPK